MIPRIRLATAAVATTAALLTGCATTTTTPDITIANTAFGPAGAASAPPNVGVTVIQRAALVFGDDLYKSAADSGNNGLALAALRSGYALLDLRCSRYLDDLGIANQGAKHERQLVDIVGGFTAAVMGLSGSSAKAVAGAATTFSFAGAGMDSFTTTFLFSDASKSITKLVRDAQHAYILAIQEDELGALDYAGAVTLLTGYEQTCRPSEIRRLIDDAVAASTVVAEMPGGQPSSNQVTILLGRLTGTLRHFVSEGDAIVLYAWFTDVPNRQAIKDQSAFIKNLNLKDEELASLLNSEFTTLRLTGDPVAKRWAGAVAQVPGTQAAAEAQVTAEAKSKAFAAERAAALAKEFAAKPAGDIKADLVKKTSNAAKTTADEKAALELMKPAVARDALVAKAPLETKATVSAMAPEVAKKEALAKASAAADAAAAAKAKASQMTPDEAKADADAKAAELTKAAEAARAVANVPPPSRPKAPMAIVAPVVRIKTR